MPNFAENSRLSPKQEQAILILLRPFHENHAKIAKEIGIAERTLRTWLALPQFQQRLKEGRAELWRESLDTITGNLKEASFVLIQLLRSGSENVRLRAALGIVSASIKCHEEFELEERISALEEALEQRRSGGM